MSFIHKLVISEKWNKVGISLSYCCLERSWRKVKLSKNTMIISASVVVLMIGGGAVCAYNSPADRAQRELKLTNNYLQEAKYQEAITDIQKIIELQPKDIPARLELGKAYVATKDFTKAEAVLKEVLQIDEDNIDAREDLFRVHLKEGNLDATNAVLREIVRNNTWNLPKFRIENTFLSAEELNGFQKKIEDDIHISHIELIR